MSEIKTEVKVFQVAYKCWSCLKGELELDGSILLDKGFYHRCNNSECTFGKHLPSIYPKTVYEPISKFTIANTTFGKESASEAAKQVTKTLKKPANVRR